MTLTIPRRLESPNVFQGRHWRVKHRISQEWEDEIRGAILTRRTLRSFYAALSFKPKAKMRVTVERHVPSMRNFIRDDDNLRFAVKPLLDALKRQGYIKNDSRKWLEHPTPTQHVSADGKDYTVITIQAVR